MSLVLEYSWWWVLPVLLLALLYSGGLYYKNRASDDMPQWLIVSLAAFRFILVVFIGLLLLSPLINTTVKNTEKPVLVFALDNTQSVLAVKDSTYYKTTYKHQLKKLVSELSETYNVRMFSFDDQLHTVTDPDSIMYNRKQTDISKVMDEIYIRYSNSNLGAVVLATDGLYNLGTNPLYVSEKINVPIYTIAMGDTTLKKDVAVKQVEHNKIAFLGNKFPLNIIVSALKLKGKEAVVKIFRGNEMLFSNKINITSDQYTTVVPAYLVAQQKGLQHYKVKVSEVEGESTIINNSKDIFVEVIDSRQKVLLLYNAPHPDVAAIKRSIEANENYEMEDIAMDAFSKKIDAYNLIILHGLPASGRLIDDIKVSNIPYWLITGAGTLMASDLSVKPYNGKTTECEAVPGKNFPLFTITDELKNAFKIYPAAHTPYVSNAVENSGEVFLYQKIGAVETTQPLMYFNLYDEVKTAVFVGEGLWRWRMYEFFKNENTQAFDEFISKTVQYLSIKQDKSFFRLSGSSLFNENESVLFYAELYNDSYELINEPEINAVITDSNNKKYNYTFSKTSNGYRLDAGILPVGEYTLEAKVAVGAKLLTQRARFHIVPLQVEMLHTVADHRLLNSLAQKNNASMLYPHEIEKLVEKLKEREEIKPVTYTQNKTSDLINNKWLFILLLLLITVEWLVRKRNGLV